MKIESVELARFLSAANKATYANANAAKSISLRPASADYHFEDGDLGYHDTYFGARDFVGEEIVYKAGVPVWGMNYYGHVLNDSVTTNEAYTILRPALMQEYDDILPVRGPQEFVLGNSRYTNTVSGPLERFSGEENIFLDGALIYRGWYHGGQIE